MLHSNKRSTSTSHEWTRFEKHTLLCLLAKGMHLEGRAKKNDVPGAAKSRAYLNVATELNKAVHKGDYKSDITKKEVEKMIERMLDERKGVIGKGGYMERQFGGRITRGLKRVWERNPAIDFDGSLSEWKSGRKAKEIQKMRVRSGETLGDNIGEAGSFEESNELGRASTTQHSGTLVRNGSWSKADTAETGSSRSRWRSNANQKGFSTASAGQGTGGEREPAESCVTSKPMGRDSYSNLPPDLQSSGKYDWAARSSANTNLSRGKSHWFHGPSTALRSGAGGLSEIKQSNMRTNLPKDPVSSTRTLIDERSSTTSNLTSHSTTPVPLASSDSATSFDLATPSDDSLAKILKGEFTRERNDSLQIKTGPLEHLNELSKAEPINPDNVDASITLGSDYATVMKETVRTASEMSANATNRDPLRFDSCGSPIRCADTDIEMVCSDIA